MNSVQLGSADSWFAQIEALKREIIELKERIEKHRGDPDAQEQPRRNLPLFFDSSAGVFDSDGVRTTEEHREGAGQPEAAPNSQR